MHGVASQSGVFTRPHPREVGPCAEGTLRAAQLFVAVLFVVGFRRLFSVAARMDRVRPCDMGMVRRFLVLSSLMVLCCFIVMAGSVSKMFVRLLVVFGSLFRHSSFSRVCVSGDCYFQHSDSFAKIQTATKLLGSTSRVQIRRRMLL
jgi:hypothetical protein